VPPLFSSKGPSEAQILEVLKTVQDPELGRDIVSLGMVNNLKVDGSKVTVTLVLTTPACPVREEFQDTVKQAILAVPGVQSADVTLDANVRGSAKIQSTNLIQGVRNIIAVGSGKGGVGKSTVSVNLAVSLAKSGAKVGLLDADIYGPNIPTMLGVHAPIQTGSGIKPAFNYGVNAISMGFFIPKGEPVVWRGPMIHGAIQQLLKDVQWGELDYLIVDLPPGTGDASLSLAQLVPLTGAVIVVTPQDVAIEDGAKAIAMFRKLNVPILGLVENMSSFVCPHCNETIDIFGKGGGQEACQQYEIEFLGDIPIDPRIRIGGDEGAPIVAAHPDSPAAQRFMDISKVIAGKISVQNLEEAGVQWISMV